jgi:lipopolysaccharide/colanic/teichoic acid biosynthesis glycosyltransferase
MKRCIDFCLALVCIIIFSPLFIICYLAIRLEDGGPAFFKQERIGLGGKPFNILKFRSMPIDENRDEYALFNHNKHEQLTRIGRFMRDHHLDELPQLINVLRGDMAFIGPRPERKYYIDLIMEQDTRYELLYQLRPGVTSYATLHNGYTDTLEKMLIRLEMDLYYLEHQSLWMDAKILMQTFFSIVGGKRF